jgi:hypothetical protein
VNGETQKPTVPSPSVLSGEPSEALDELIAAQGVRPLARFEDLFGAGRDWWTDAEFAAFLEQVRATRREKD